MQQYLEVIEHASTELITLIYEDEEELVKLNRSLEGISDFGNQLYARFSQFQHGPHANYYYNMFLQEKEKEEGRHEETENKIEEVLTLIEAKESSVASLSGALLQIAKQGISITYKESSDPLDTCKDGRNIGSIPIKHIIWQGRNQAMHSEESPDFKNKSINKLFDNLKKEQGDSFDLSNFPSQSLAKSIVDLLSWKSFNSFAEDMNSLC